MHYKWFGEVRRKYNDPTVMAHHSNTWEFSALDQYIARNFNGLGRIRNRIRYTPAVASLANTLIGIKPFIKKALGR